jgi:hypothetical protein
MPSDGGDRLCGDVIQSVLIIMSYFTEWCLDIRVSKKLILSHIRYDG